MENINKNKVGVTKSNQIWSNYDGIHHEDFLAFYLKWQLNVMEREKKTFTIVSIELSTFDRSDKIIVSDDVIMEFAQFLRSKVRDSDFIFRTHCATKFYILLIPHSGIKEGLYFIKRVQDSFIKSFSETDYYLTNALLEVNDAHHKIEEILIELEEVHKRAALSEHHTAEQMLKETENEQRLKVAVVDSDPITQTVIKNVLSSLSIPHTRLDIMQFTNGEDYMCSEIYRSSEVQLVILSDILPQRDGIEVLQELRALPDEAKYLVIILGSRNTEEEMTYAMEHGADDYIAKPFNVNLFAVKVKRLLKRGI